MTSKGKVAPSKLNAKHVTINYGDNTSTSDHDDLPQLHNTDMDLIEHHYGSTVRSFLESIPLSHDQEEDVRVVNLARTFSDNLLTMSGKLMIDGCADTSIAAIGNGFVEVSGTDRSVKIIGFDSDLAKYSIPIGSAVTSVDLPTGTIVIQIN